MQVPERPVSPIHIHVNDITPVHVHVKKHRKLKPTLLSNDRLNRAQSSSGQIDKTTMVSEDISAPPPTAVIRHAPVKTRPRSRSPQHLGPWVPPPAKSTRGSKYIYQGSTQRLDRSSPSRDDGTRDDDGELDTEDEERTLGKMRDYERTIEALMKEVGALKNEVALQKNQKELQKKDDDLKASAKLLENREQELKELKNLAENIAASGSSTKPMTKSDRVLLMKKLIEVEMDGQAVAAEFTRLQEAVKKRKDSNVLGHLREQLHEKLSVFEANNRALRHLLRDQHEFETSVLYLVEQRDLLEQKLSDAENILRNLESQLSHERAEADHVQQVLIQERDKSEMDKDALKKATRAQKERVSQRENALENANTEIQEHQTVIRELHAEMTSLKYQNDRLLQEKQKATSEIAQLNVQIVEMEGVFERMAADSKRDLDATISRLHERTSDLSECRLENERLKTSLSVCEEQLSHSRKEMSRVQKIANDYEHQMEKYRKEVHGPLQTRVEELAPLSEALRKTESQLEERTEELERLRRRQTDYDRQIRDMRLQVDKQFDFEDQRRDLLLKMTEKEEAYRQVNLQLQELTRENVDLQRQLEAVTSSEQRMLEGERQKASAKDRAYGSQILDLESQISQTRNEITRVKREKEEAERRLRSQLTDVQGRLDQCESAKRCLQNYLQFIQSSYCSTFGDSIVNSPSAHSLTSPYSSSRRSPFI